MADAVETFKKFPLSLQLILGGAAVVVIGSFLDIYSDFDGNLLDSTTGLVALGAIVFGAIVAYLKKFQLWSLVAILLGSGGIFYLFLGTVLDSGPDMGLGLILLTIGAAAASWGAITAEQSK